VAPLTLLSGYGFDDHDGPYVVVDELSSGATERRRVRVRGVPLTLTASEQRRCTGSFDLDNYESAPCPAQAVVSGDLETCYACFRRTGFNPSFYNLPRAALSPQQRAYNQRPHVVYLAYFAEDCVKVGISSQDRVLARWRGQGARLATQLITSDNAEAAREMEARVAREASVSEAVRGARKRQLLNVPLSTLAATETLRALRQSVAQICGFETAQTPIHDLTPHYLGSARLDLPLTDVGSETTPSISGVGVGLIGDVLIVDEAGRQYMLSLKDLMGRVVSLEHHVRPNHRRPVAGQLGFSFS
jgi:uncharacterized protein DUF2797